MVAISSSQRQIYRAAMQLFAERGVTQLNVTDLAHAAGVARGTIYNNLSNIEALFEDVAADLAIDMNDRVIRSFDGLEDPAERLATAMRLYVRRAHEEPHWGRFLTRFGLSVIALHHLWDGQPMEDLKKGVLLGRYSIQEDQLPSAVSLVAGSTLGAIFLVMEGIKTWREAGSHAAELTLTALGLPRHEARALASCELPPLAPPE
jgi:AcrR family transcriptional regulator